MLLSQLFKNSNEAKIIDVLIQYHRLNICLTIHEIEKETFNVIPSIGVSLSRLVSAGIVDTYEIADGVPAFGITDSQLGDTLTQFTELLKEQK